MGYSLWDCKVSDTTEHTHTQKHNQKVVTVTHKDRSAFKS